MLYMIFKIYLPILYIMFKNIVMAYHGVLIYTIEDLQILVGLFIK